MFISKLTRTVEESDPYGIHRIDGCKVVYVYFMLSVFNVYFYIPHPYFYFFYLPLTAMAAEITGNTIESKYQGFIYTVLATCVLAFFFNMFRPYPLFFLFGSFVLTALFYYIALRYVRMLLPIVPICLALAIYSHLYPSISANPRMMIANVLSTLFALTIIVSSLSLFPLSYYYRSWLRAFVLILKEILQALLAISRQKDINSSLGQGHLQHMVGVGKMLPRKFPCYSVLKVNLLMNQIFLSCLVEKSEIRKLETEDLALFIKNIELLIEAVQNEQQCRVIFDRNKSFNKMIGSWNQLCLRA
ncbi:MAG: hypothetical protein P1U74_02700 [Legionellaceae bacterium]|nr:hypothetical protein [Legionellaceae bacterium]